MRLILNLKSNATTVQNIENNSKFYTSVNGWIYNKLKDTEYSNLHDLNNFKLFCFSNLFPIKNQKIIQNEFYKLIISSPDEMFMVSLISKIDLNEKINLGEYSFELIGKKPIGKINLDEIDYFESMNLINLNSPIKESDKLVSKAITYESDSEKFVKQLSSNLFKKYKQFKGEIEQIDLFKGVIIEPASDEKAIKLNFIENKNNNYFNVIGKRYKFKFEKLNENQKKVFELCYDLGFGERNTFGFGFMNSKKKGETK
ncbi:MAG: CRISPR-associated endoribonuclease Cas6 [Candidatus ainarchaeum sp.]|nr:CRISPR-associated endoribonuclease Cas6 [Candidatus ainarchaeum sp.]